MSENKPYEVEMYGHRTTLLLSEEDAKLRGVWVDPEPEPEEVDTAPVDLNDAATPAEVVVDPDGSTEVVIGQDGIPVLHEKQAPAPANKARQAKTKTS